MNSRTLMLVPVFVAAALLLAAGGCATPFDIGKAERNITPGEAAKNPAIAKHIEVAWGGVLVTGKNLAEHTQLEVVGYPLDSDNRPKPNTGPLGRFIVIHPGYLETSDYAPGRLVTVVGAVTETRHGKVGEAAYVFPVVTANRLHLWPRESQAPTEPRIQFGIGIGISR